MNQSKSKAAYVATLAVLLACMVLGGVRRRRSWNGNKKWVRVRRKDVRQWLFPARFPTAGGPRHNLRQRVARIYTSRERGSARVPFCYNLPHVLSAGTLVHHFGDKTMMQTIRSLKAVKFAPIVLLLAIISIAAAPAALATPNAPTAAATSNAGEIVASWQSVAGAQFYTVGWINRNDYQQIGSSGDWQSAFHYATIPASRTSYTVNGLKAGEEYWTIIGARTTRVGGDSPSWSAWSGLVTTAGQHGAGFCPITGLPLPPGGYLGVGDTATFGSYTITINSIATPNSVTLSATDGTTVEREAPSGRRWLEIYVTLVNRFDFAVNLRDGKDYVLSTEVGNAFSWNTDLPLDPDHQYDNIYLLFDIPQDATTAVLAVRPLTARTGDNAPNLFRVSIPATDAR